MPVAISLLQQPLLKDYEIFLMPALQTSWGTSAPCFAISFAMNSFGALGDMKQVQEHRYVGVRNKGEKSLIEHSSPLICLCGFQLPTPFWVVWSAEWLQIEAERGLKLSVQCTAHGGLGVTSSSPLKALVQVQKETELQVMNTDDLYLVPDNSNNGEYERLLIKRLDLCRRWENQQIQIHLVDFSAPQQALEENIQLL